jgi:hypothetical protein
VKRAAWAGETIVFAYGARRGADLPDYALEQLRLTHELRNALVAIELRLDEATAELWGTQSEVALCTERLEQCDAAVRAAVGAVQEHKKRTRNGLVPDDLRAAVKAARVARRAARQSLNAAKESAYLQLRPTLVELHRERDRARKALYAQYVQNQGLYWATFNMAMSQHEAAARRTATLRAQGRQAGMRQRLWTGEGTLAVTLQRKAGEPRRSPGTLADGTSRWRNIVRLPRLETARWETMTRAERRRAGRQLLAFRVGSNPDRSPIWAEVAVAWHRPLPELADITQVQVSRRRIAGHHRLTFAITCRLPPVERTDSSRPAIAIDIGWRSLGDGTIRLATWAATGPLDIRVTEELRQWIRAPAAGATTGEIVVPGNYRRAHREVDQLRSIRNIKLIPMRSGLVSWLSQHGDTCKRLGVIPDEVAAWRSPSPFAALVRSWRTHHPSYEDDIVAQLEAWRRQDRHLWEWERHYRDQLAAHRTDVYRKLARLVIDTAGCLIIEQLNLQAVARRPAPEDSLNVQARAARVQRTIAAPGLLRSSLCHAASRIGLPVLQLNRNGTTSFHHRCGTEIDRQGRVLAESATVWCPVCKERYDQDVNTCQNLLKQTLEPSRILRIAPDQHSR